MRGRSIISRGRGERVGIAGSSLKGAGCLQRSHCSGAVVLSGSHSADVECPTFGRALQNAALPHLRAGN